MDSNAANLSFFKVNFSYALLQPFRQQNLDYSILDLKPHDRGCRYAIEKIKCVRKNPTSFYWLIFFYKSPVWALFTRFYSLPPAPNSKVLTSQV
jgi:hypothetical protein